MGRIHNFLHPSPAPPTPFPNADPLREGSWHHRIRTQGITSDITGPCNIRQLGTIRIWLHNAGWNPFFSNRKSGWPSNQQSAPGPAAGPDQEFSDFRFIFFSGPPGLDRALRNEITSFVLTIGWPGWPVLDTPDGSNPQKGQDQNCQDQRTRSKEPGAMGHDQKARIKGPRSKSQDRRERTEAPGPKGQDQMARDQI